MANKISFEDAVERLELASESLRSGNLTLEQSVKIYEDSLKYYEQASNILKEAKQKIEIYRPETGEVEVFEENVR